MVKAIKLMCAVARNCAGLFSALIPQRAVPDRYSVSPKATREFKPDTAGIQYWIPMIAEATV
jgi:hypothetical protein